MKKTRTYREKVRRVQLGEMSDDGGIERLLEIKSVSNFGKEKGNETKKSSEALQFIANETLQVSPVKQAQLVMYMKALEEENKKLQFEIFSVKEENMQLALKNKELQVKNTSQQSYITRLNVEISKLQRNLYQAAAMDIQSTQKIKIKSTSRNALKTKHLIRSISNSYMEKNLKDLTIGNSNNKSFFR